MKKLLFFLVFLLFEAKLFSQNLISNADFSAQNPNSAHNKLTLPNVCNAGIHTSCWDCLEDWYGTSAFYHYCVIGGPFRPWAHPGGLLPPAMYHNGMILPSEVSGDGYVSALQGLIFPLGHPHAPDGSFVPLPFYLYQKLQHSLEEDTTYVLEFYAQPNRHRGNLTMGKFHSFFYSGPSDSDYVDLYPHTYGRELIKYESPTAEWVGDPIPISTWTRITMSFTANGNEKSFYILRFSDPDSSNLDVSGGAIDLFFDAFALYKASDTLFSVSIGNDTLLCPGEELTLTANLDDGFKLDDTVTTYLWNTGDTVPQITVNSPGTYWVEVTINHRFKARDSIVVDYEEPLEWGFPFDEEHPIERCYSDLPITIAGPEASHDAQYIWSTGESTRTIDVRDEGYYHLRVVTECFDEEGSFTLKPVNCQIDSSMFDGHVFIPNAFTPNGRNPQWIISGIGPNTRVEVYNRWGQRVFYSEDYLHNWWDGTFNGTLLPSGVYTYRIIAPFDNKDPVDRIGTVTIVR